MPSFQFNRLWHVSVGVGRFIVRAPDEGDALALARKEAEDYNANAEEVMRQAVHVELLSPDGEPAVLDVDYS